MRVAFHTLGGKVNHYETEALREAFVSRGAVSVPEDDPADVYIINTCTVTNIADRKSRQYIRRMKKVNPDALIVEGPKAGGHLGFKSEQLDTIYTCGDKDRRFDQEIQNIISYLHELEEQEQVLLIFLDIH